MNKDLIIFGLIAALVASLIFAAYFFAVSVKKRETETKIVYKQQVLTPAKVRNWLLSDGIEYAWVSNEIADIKADCFADGIRPEDGQSTFIYCKLREPLSVDTK